MAVSSNIPTVDETDEIIQLNQGSEIIFSTIYNRYHQRVYGNILRLVHVAEYAEEILQDVFLSLWQNRHRIDKDRPVVSWLFVVSFNKSMDFLKKKVRDHIDFIADYDSLYVAVDDVSEQDAILEEQLRILEEAIDHLSPRKKEVFRLYRTEGHSKEHVAQMLDLSISSVSEYLKQANKSIKQYVAGHSSYEYGNGVFLLVTSSLYL
ncbi:MAG: sigma-70 family RNA polymerase sigma factor [Sphingobacterium sp.]|jgi:RNA polymerase sigma-70 factor (ECF subfamily)|nr:sigma-70 family RNA polymerase sigma factor [Sphingobacterium sp.]